MLNTAIARFIGVKDLTADELQRIEEKCKKNFMGSDEHSKKFDAIAKPKKDGEIERRARKVNLQKKQS